MIGGVGAAFVQGILPVLLIGGLGYLVGRARRLDLGPVTGLTVLGWCRPIPHSLHGAPILRNVVILGRFPP
jgi:hypothetical protein